MNVSKEGELITWIPWEIFKIRNTGLQLWSPRSPGKFEPEKKKKMAITKDYDL